LFSGRLSLKPCLKLKRGSDSLAFSTDGRVTLLRREMKLAVRAIAIVYENGSFRNSKRKNKVRNPRWLGVGAPGILSTLYQF
jgi:hypothetical protein